MLVNLLIELHRSTSIARSLPGTCSFHYLVFIPKLMPSSESCIKGHRSSSCHHTDRPLFEIKKKGRPVSQCSKCRELRQSKKFHSKCTCNHPKESTPAVQPLASFSTSKSIILSYPIVIFTDQHSARRFIPIVPALPNGLRDALSASSSSTSLPPDSRQRGRFWTCPLDVLHLTAFQSIRY